MWRSFQRLSCYRLRVDITTYRHAAAASWMEAQRWMKLVVELMLMMVAAVVILVGDDEIVG